MEQFSVKKWGGENAAELVKSSQNVLDDFNKGKKQAIVVSAIRSPDFNTTDYLIELGKMLSSGDEKITSIIIKINEIRDFHISVVDEKLGKNNKIIGIIQDFFCVLVERIYYWMNHDIGKNNLSRSNDYTIVLENELFSIVGFGEFLSALIHKEVINDLGVEGLEAKLLDGRELIHSIDRDSKFAEIFKGFSKNISKSITGIINDNKIPVLSGYIPGCIDGYESKIGRGYTDLTAAMASVGLTESYDVTLEIQKSVLGLLSADPRIIGSETKLIDRIDYVTAKEITGVRGAQAKLLHNKVLTSELQEAGVKVRIFDPSSDSKGTLITKEKDIKASGVEYIGGREKVIFFSISSSEMSGIGILSNVFDIVKKYSSVDIVSTSETEISFTIDGGLDDELLTKMSNEIKDKLKIKEDKYVNFVRYNKNKALIFCIGQNLYNKAGILGKAASILGSNGINIEMISQGTMERAIIFGVDGEDKEKAIKLLHDGLIDVKINIADKERRDHGIIV